MNSQLHKRYRRQMILPGMGQEGQQKLLNAKVLMIGAGGLGCPVLQYLVAAGVGTIGIADDDVVALHNLHRQILYSTKDIGLPKALRAAEKLKELNPEINIITYNERLTNKNALRVLAEFDIIIDGTDSFSTRYMINDACVILGKTLVFGAISRFEGQIGVFDNSQKDAVNYRDLFPNPPKDDEVLNCAEAGVIGVLPGIIGTMMANETIKYITGIGKPLVNQLLTYNCLNNQTYLLSLAANPATIELIPANEAAFKKMDYVQLCSSALEDLEIDRIQFDNLLREGQGDFVDVREPGETPSITEFPTFQIPLARLEENISQLRSDTIVVICQSGKRSLQGAKTLSGIFGSGKKIYSLKEGIVAWKNNQQHERTKA